MSTYIVNDHHQAKCSSGRTCLRQERLPPSCVNDKEQVSSCKRTVMVILSLSYTNSIWLSMKLRFSVRFLLNACVFVLNKFFLFLS